MKVAHLIMAYKNPHQIEKLIKSMAHPDFFIYIHLDKKVNIKDFQYLETYERVVFIKNRVVCNWGGFSFVRAIFSSLKEILSLREDYSFINLMSAQDYPIRPMDQLYSFLVRNNGKCFISYENNPKQKWWSHARKRLELYHFTDLNFKGKYFIQSIINKILPKRTYPLDMLFYGSSDASWWTITSECALYMVNFMDNDKKLRNFLKYTWGADEFVVTTIIMNSPFKDRVVNNNLRLITWTDGLANPRILISEDMEIIKESDRFFARKFDITVDAKIIDDLDQFLLHTAQRSY
jgi:hypothetical protein